MAKVDDAANALRQCKDDIEKKGIARSHGDTLEKRGISVDQFLIPSRDKDLKKIKYFSRNNKEIRDKFLKFQIINFKNGQVTFTKEGYDGDGKKWDKLLSDYIKGTDTEHSQVAKELLDSIKELTEGASFLESKFAFFGFMRERASDETKEPKVYLWQGEADAIAYHPKLEKFVIVDFKVVDNLSYYWEKKTDLCGKHLHQCLVYAKLLKLHMSLDYLPPSLMVVIDRVTGREGFFPLFEDYPEECKNKLNEYEWFTEQPPKPPLRMVKNDKLFREDTTGFGIVASHLRLNELFNERATVDDLLKVLGYDSLKLVGSLAKGQRYEYGDFVLKFGQVSAGPSFKGLVVDLEYQPCEDIGQCWGLMSEFLISFMDESFTLPSPPKSSNKNTELFCPSDTILQYIEVFNTYRKSMGAAAGPLSQ